MPGIDWAYLGSIGGEGIEDFVATCLRQRYPDARQTRPARGDGGIDIVRDTPDGVIVWQIKKFTAPLTSSQKQQVKKSWKRFWNTHVAAGKTIKQYYLATPWTPTDGYLSWFETEVTAAATFSTQWDGAAFFNGLAADYPATADRFFKGPDMLENMVNAKAMLAASPIEATDQPGLLAALNAREVALRSIRDMVSDNYFVDTGTRTAANSGELPLPSPTEAGIYYRYTALGNDRFHIQSVVPKTAQSLEIEPISLDLTFTVTPGSDDASKVEGWRVWGIPFANVPGEMRQRGGPLADAAQHRGMISFLLSPDQIRSLDVELVVAGQGGGTPKAELALTAKEVTSGIVGAGMRIVATSSTGIVETELRFGSSVQEDSWSLTITDPEDLQPSAVRDDLAALVEVEPDDVVTLSIKHGPVLAAGTGFDGAARAELILEIATSLISLQRHTTEQFAMPALADITARQLELLQRLTKIYDGIAFEATWERITVTLGRSIEDELAGLVRGEGSIVVTRQPTFHLGSSAYRVTRLLAEQYLRPIIRSDIDLRELVPGDEIELVPNGDNRLVVAVIVDATP